MASRALLTQGLRPSSDCRQVVANGIVKGSDEGLSSSLSLNADADDDDDFDNVLDAPA